MKNVPSSKAVHPLITGSILTHWLHGAESLRNWYSRSWWKNYLPFMETDGSSACSQ